MEDGGRFSRKMNNKTAQAKQPGRNSPAFGKNSPTLGRNSPTSGKRSPGKSPIIGKNSPSWQIGRISKTPERKNHQLPPLAMQSLSPDPDDPTIMPRAVQEVMNNLAEAKRDRKKYEVASQVEDILFRVKQALAHAGLSVVLEPTQSEMEFGGNRPPRHLLGSRENEAKRQEREYQRSILDMVHVCLDGCSTQKLLLGDLCDWLDTHDNLLTYTCPESELNLAGLEADRSVEEVKEALTYASKVVGKIRALGYYLMKEAGFIPDTVPTPTIPKEKVRKEASETDAENLPAEQSEGEPDSVQAEIADEMDAMLKSLPVAKKETMEQIKIHDEAAILADATLFQTAVANVTKVMQKCVRALVHNHEKQALRDALKQYKHVSDALKIQQDDLVVKTKELTKVNLEVEEFKNAASVWEDEYKKAERRNSNLERKVEKLEYTVDDLKREKGQLETEIEDMKIEHEEQMLEMRDKRISVVSFSSTNTIIKEASFGSRTILQATESAIHTATREYQDQIDALRLTLAEKENTILDLEKKVSEGREDIEKLEARIELTAAISAHENTTTIEKVVIDTKYKEEMVKKIKELIDEKESAGRQLGRMKGELHKKMELIKYQERCIKDLKEELGQIDVDEFLKGNTKLQDGNTPDAEVKRMVQRMQKDFQTDLSRFKAYMEKEKQRHEATLRKQEQTHKDQMQNTHKQSLHLLRALNRFKEQISALMDREGLHMAATDIRRLPSLNEEEMPSDPRSMLAHMTSGAVELLVTIEMKLSQALMNKRIEIKDNTIAKKFATKDLESQTEIAQKAKHAADILAEKLRNASSRLTMAESTLTEMRRVEDERHKGITERYRRLMKQYMDIQQGMDKLQKKYRKTVRYKDRAMKTVLVNKESIAKLMEDQQSYISSIEEHITKSRDEHRRQLALSISDQKHNLKLLDQALKENRITHDTYAMTAQILKKSMQLPMLKLRNLFLRYIAFRKYKDMKEEFHHQSRNHLLAENQRECLLLQQHFDHKFDRCNNQWKNKTEILETRRRDLFEEMDKLCNYVIAETGILLLQPDMRLRGSRKPLIPTPAMEAVEAGSSVSSGSEKSGHMIKSPVGSQPVPRGHATLSDSLDLRGTALHLTHHQDDMWCPADTDTDTDRLAAAVEVPHIVDLEVNQIMRAAKLALQRAGKYKRGFPVAHAEVFDYGTPSQVVPVNKVLPSHGRRCYGNRSIFSDDTTDSGTLSSSSDREKLMVAQALLDQSIRS